MSCYTYAEPFWLFHWSWDRSVLNVMESDSAEFSPSWSWTPRCPQSHGVRLRSVLNIMPGVRPQRLGDPLNSVLNVMESDSAVPSTSWSSSSTPRSQTPQRPQRHGVWLHNEVSVEFRTQNRPKLPNLQIATLQQIATCPKSKQITKQVQSV